MKNYHITKRRASNSEIRYRPALMHPKQDIIIGVLAGESLYDASCHLERLIDATVSACIKLNPGNPIAVAKSISDLYEKLLKVQKWLEMLIRNAEHQLLTCRFATLGEALKSDINNYKATLSDIRQATAKAKMPQSQNKQKGGSNGKPQR